MKIISGFREKQLKKMKDQWDIDRVLVTTPVVDKDKLITLMKENLDKIFVLLEMN